MTLKFRRLSRVVVLLAGLLVLSSPASPASAHAVLQSSNPADGAVVDVAPTEISLKFDETVQARADAIKMFNADAKVIPLGTAKVLDSVVTADLPAGLPDGSYVVSWRVISLDGHPVTGAFTYSIGAPSANFVAPPAAASDSGLESALSVANFLGYLGALGAVGLAIFLVFAFDGGAERLLLLRLTTIGALVGVIGLAAAVPLQAAIVVGRGFGGIGDAVALVEQAAGGTGVACALAAIGLAVTVMCAAPRARSVRLDVGTALGAATTLATFAVVGHTRTFHPAWLVISADVTHVTAGAVWFGGLVGLVTMLAVRRAGTPAAASSVASSAAVVARFSAIAGVTLVAVAVSGTLMGWRIVRTLHALFTTTYGQLLLVKIALVGVVVVMGAYNRYRLVPMVTGTSTLLSGRLRLVRTVRYEAAIIILVLGVTSVLVNRSPIDSSSGARPQAQATSQPAPSQSATAAPSPTDGPSQPPKGQQLRASLGTGADAGQVVVAVSATTVGPATLDITLTDAAGQPLVPREPPVVQLYFDAQQIGPIDRPVELVEPGRYRAEANFSLPGRWTIDVVVRTSEYAMPIAQLFAEIGPNAG